MSSSLIQRCYYAVKPWLPRRVRYALRRMDVRRRRARYGDIWPILPGSEVPPPNWPGWPEGRQFAFVLTHDVEGVRGLERCRALMDLEVKHGFRSSFNFVPEGEYRVPEALRAELIARGFEVGVHDLHHDGSLFRDAATFSAQARRINEYLQAWGAVGFRAGFMFHNLEWQQQLHIRYDLSTFDVDPFEPQPEGVGTIFPFWVAPVGNGGPGFVELPYTLAQDSTLFLFLRERTIDLWKRKLDWVAQHGGLALVNVHPDYLNFETRDATAFEFPAAWYAELLDYVRSRYADRCWHALPCELAEYCARFKPEHPGTRVNIAARRPDRGATGAAWEPGRNGTPRVKIWIDLDNTPHVPLFVPARCLSGVRAGRAEGPALSPHRPALRKEPAHEGVRFDLAFVTVGAGVFPGKTATGPLARLPFEGVARACAGHPDDFHERLRTLGHGAAGASALGDRAGRDF